MLNQRRTVDITRSHRYQLRAQVDKIKSHFIQSVWDNFGELYDLHHFESAAERLEFIDSLLADNKYLFPVAERVEGGVRGPNPTQRESKADNEASVHCISWRRQSRRLSTSNFIICPITAGSMLMDFIIP
jgi:hypothetical protein